MNCKQIIIMLPAILSLSSCGIYTNYHRPESLPVDSLYRDVPKAIQDTASLADLSWRELFTDSLLVKWIEVGLEKNSDIQTARLLTEEAQALAASLPSGFPTVRLAGAARFAEQLRRDKTDEDLFLGRHSRMGNRCLRRTA